MATAFVVAIALTSSATLATAAHATPQADLASEQQKATQLEAEIEANGNRVSVLDQQYLEAQSAIQKATDELNADQARLEVKARETSAVRSLLAARAAELYMGAGNPTPLADFDVTSTQALGSRSAYSAAAADQDHQLLDSAKVAIEQLGLQQQALTKARAKAVDQRNLLDATRRQITEASAQQEALLSQVKGRIKTLVDEVQAQKEREQEAAARASMQRVARQQAEERAQAAALQQQRQQQRDASSGSDSTSGTTTNSTATPDPPQDLPAPSEHAQAAVDAATAQLGKPYVYAGSGPGSFDCSGLTMFAWAAAGVSLPHNAEAQYQSLPHVPQDALEPGDLVFYGSPIHHVGIYVGGGTMIEAPYTGVNVRYHTIYRPDFAGAARP